MGRCRWIPHCRGGLKNSIHSLTGFLNICFVPDITLKEIHLFNSFKRLQIHNPDGDVLFKQLFDNGKAKHSVAPNDQAFAKVYGIHSLGSKIVTLRYRENRSEEHTSE